MNGNCPVCKIQLSSKEIDEKDHSYIVQYCSHCRREFYRIKEDENERLEYDDIEPVSSSNDKNEGPVLLCLEDKKQKEKHYKTMLKRHFGSHVTVETEIYIPE